MTRLGFFRAPIDLYKLDQNGRVDSPPQIVTCEDDDAALIEARKYVDAHAFEIWFREQASWIDPTRRVRPPQMALFHSGLTSPSDPEQTSVNVLSLPPIERSEDAVT